MIVHHSRRYLGIGATYLTGIEGVLAAGDRDTVGGQIRLLWSLNLVRVSVSLQDQVVSDDEVGRVKGKGQSIYCSQTPAIVWLPWWKPMSLRGSSCSI